MKKNISTALPSLVTLQALQQLARDTLKKAGVESYQIDADILLAFVMQRDRSFLLSHGDDPVSGFLQKKFERLIARRKKHEPIAYITQQKEFYGRNFFVNKHVLIPRPLTEELIDTAKSILQKLDLSKTLVIDIGTGSGAIAITIKKEFPTAQILAIDISKRALAVFQKNAKIHGLKTVEWNTNTPPNSPQAHYPLSRGEGDALSGRKEKSIHPLSRGAVCHEVASRVCLDNEVFFLHSNLLSQLSTFNFKLLTFSNIILLANLPYIPTADIATLESDVKNYEPKKALDGGSDGLDLYRRLFLQIQQKFPKNNVTIITESLREDHAELQKIFASYDLRCVLAD